SDVLLHLDHDADRRLAGRVVEGERVVDLGQLLRLELDVEHRADDLDDPADISRCGSRCHVSFLSVSLVPVHSATRDPRPATPPLAALCSCRRYPCSAAAPPTISEISCVIAAWRWRLYVRFSASRMSPALSVAFFMAVRRAPCSAAAVSTSPRYTALRTYSGSSRFRISSADGESM